MRLTEYVRQGGCEKNGFPLDRLSHMYGGLYAADSNSVQQHTYIERRSKPRRPQHQGITTCVGGGGETGYRFRAGRTISEVPPRRTTFPGDASSPPMFPYSGRLIDPKHPKEIAN